MLRAGQTLGAYRIESMLGRGAMGVVYRGVGIGSDEPVAIKTVHTDLLVGPERDAVLARFRQEARIGMRLRHPLIVRVRDYGELDGIIYLTMDFIPGQELGRMVERGPELPLGMSLAVMLQVLNALAYAHGQDVIHRDIKPSNILIRQDYTIALTDFGIAHVGGSELTQAGDLLGSPLYMAPEQLRGEPLDRRADLFSAGVVLYYLLTRHKPFAADSMAALMQKVLGEDPLPPSAVNRTLPATFDPVMRRALAKDRRQRFASAFDFAAALRLARTAAAEATVIVPAGRPSKPATSPVAVGPDRAALAGSTLEDLGERVAALMRECLAGRVTGPRLNQLAEGLEAWFVLAEQPTLTHAARETEQQRLRQWCVGQPLAALVERILRDAPLPGRMLEGARGDWLELIRLFALLRDAGRRLGGEPVVEAAQGRIIRELAGAFLSYSGILNRLLFGEDDPQLARISADFMRLDLLQLALDELGAEAEGRGVRQTLLLFVNQVMGKVNVLIRKFLGHRDPLGRFGVTNLLVEVEELIVLAERLLESNAEITPAEASGPGGAAMADFIDSARSLGHLLASELMQQFQLENRRMVETGQPDFGRGQTVFVGQLRQLGLLYRFAARLESDARVESLRQMTAEVHHDLETLTDALLAALPAAAGPEQRVAMEPLWARLSVIVDLAERFGWLELRQKVLIAIRNRAVVA